MNQGYKSFRRIREIERAKKVQLTSRFKLIGEESGTGGDEKQGAAAISEGAKRGRSRWAFSEQVRRRVATGVSAEYGRGNEGKGRSWEEREAETARTVLIYSEAPGGR
jgi:hypothetical protein